MKAPRKPALIRGVEWLKNRLGLRTYTVEYVVVGAVLIAVALVSRKGPVEWIGVVAVFLTFGHASIAERLRELRKNWYIREAQSSKEAS